MSKIDIFMGDVVVGYIDFDVREQGVYLHWTYVQPAHRGQGISTRAIKAVCAKAAQMGLPVFIDFVFGESEGQYRTTEAARSFYFGLGFREAFRYGEGDQKARVVWTDPREPFDGHVLTPAGAYEYLLGESSDSG